VDHGQTNWRSASAICNLYSITTNQAAIIAFVRVISRYVGNQPPMPGVFPDYPAPVIRNTDAGTEMVTMRWTFHRRRARAGRRSPISDQQEILPACSLCQKQFKTGP